MTVYAIADVVPNADYLTAGKRYEVLEDKGKGFVITDDDGDRLYCLWEDCAHLVTKDRTHRLDWRKEVSSNA